MLKIVRATEADIEHIAANLDSRTLEELLAFGYRDAAHVKEGMLVYLTSPWAYALRDGDEPLAFTGAMEAEPGLVRTWLHISDRFSRVGLRATKMLRWFLTEQIVSHPEYTVEIATVSPNPKADVWIGLLGFRPYKTDGSVRIFRPVGSC